MTISALLLARQFYHYKPSPRLCYATIGLLFVNVSVGGTLTHFAAPPMVDGGGTMALGQPCTCSRTLGWKAFVGIVCSTASLLSSSFQRGIHRVEQVLPAETARAHDPGRRRLHPALDHGGADPFSSSTRSRSPGTPRSSSADSCSSWHSPRRPPTTRKRSTSGRRFSSAFFSRGSWSTADCRAGGWSRCLKSLGRVAPPSPGPPYSRGLTRQRGHHLSCYACAGLHGAVQVCGRRRRRDGRRPDRHRQCAEPRGPGDPPEVLRRRSLAGEAFSLGGRADHSACPRLSCFLAAGRRGADQLTGDGSLTQTSVADAGFRLEMPSRSRRLPRPASSEGASYRSAGNLCCCLRAAPRAR